MFGKLKDKLKGALKKFTKEVEEESEILDEEIITTPPAKPSKESKAKQVTKKPTSKDDDESDADSSDSELLAEQPLPKETSSMSKKAQDNEPSEPGKEPLVPEESLSQSSTKPKEEAPKKKFFGMLSKKKEKVQETEVPHSEPEEVAEVSAPKEKKEGFFTKLTNITLSEDKFDELFWELEITLLENNVAVEVIEKIKSDLKHALTGEKMQRKSVEDIIRETLKHTLSEILRVPSFDLIEKANEKNSRGEPLIIAMIGVNGSGKTTTLAKLIKYFQDNNKTVVVAAADTFRAAAIDQLEEHTKKLGVRLIKHDYNADPAAVAFDAVKHAKAQGINIVLIDSAGRLHSNDNLMNELKKLIRINTPDVKLFVGEAITGNDCVEQATLFDQAVGIDGIILAKADVDDKGGAAISASFVTKKPVLFLGTGQEYHQLTAFNPELILENLGL